MTYVADTAGELLLIEIGDGGSPEIFAHPCSINTSRAFDMSSAVSVTEVADCANQSAPAKTVRVVKSTDSKITGAGVMDGATFLMLMQWWKSGAQKNVKVYQGLTGANGGWTFTAPFVITALNDTGIRAEKQTCTLTLDQADAGTLVANA